MSQKRTRGEGTLYYSESKDLWIWQYRYTANGVSYRKSLTAKRRIDLKEKVDKFITEYKQGLVYSADITLTEWIEKWLEIFVKPTVKIKTYDNYKHRLQYVVDTIGYRKIKSVTNMEIQSVLNELSLSGGQQQQGLAGESIRCIRRYLKAVFNSAIKNKIITENPVEGTKAPKKIKRKPVVLNELQTTTFLEVARSGQYIYHGIKNPKFLTRNAGTDYYIKSFYNLVNLAFATGMRIGELRGLSWSNVNFAKKTVTVKTQIIDSSEQDCQFDDPKTEKSERNISVDNQTMEELFGFKNYQKKYADHLGDQYDNQYDLCFTNTFGKPFSASNFRRRYFSKIRAVANLPEKFTIHCMRHTHATLLLKNGVNPKVVSERLGHSSVIVTLNIYAHVLEEMEQEAPGIWESIMNKSI